MFTTSLALVMSIYPKEKRGRAVGFVTATVYIGLALGPSLGGILTQYLGWRSLFYINILPALVIIFILLRYLKGEWAEAKGEKFDLAGAIVYALGIFGLIYGLSNLPDYYAFVLTLAGIALLIAFVRIQIKVNQPLIKIALLVRNRIFAFSNLAAFINYAATFGVGFLLSLYLQYSQGLRPKDAGLVLVAQPLVMALVSPFAGRLSDKFDPRILSSTGMAVSTFGLILISFVNQQTSITFIVVSLLILGLGFALFSSPNTNAVMSSVEKKELGIASATLSTMRLLGQMMSMVIVMLAINFFIGKVKLSVAVLPQLLTSIKVSLYIFSVLCIVGVFASLARGKKLYH